MGLAKLLLGVILACTLHWIKVQCDIGKVNHPVINNQ